MSPLKQQQPQKQTYFKNNYEVKIQILNHNKKKFNSPDTDFEIKSCISMTWNTESNDALEKNS